MELCSICGGWHRVTPKTYEFPEVEDIHPAYCAAGYMCTNEQAYIFSELLGDQKFKRIAAICSGGEMLLFLLLPRVTDELIAVDHSYRALGAAIVKIQILVNIGAEACKTLFTMPRNSKNILAVAQPFIEALPQTIQSALRNIDENGHRLFDHTHCEALLTYWRKAKIEDLEASIKNVNKLKFVHGDMRDIAPRGPFDLAYFSNAFDHRSRENLLPDKEQFNPLVRPGGHALTAGTYHLSGWIVKRAISSLPNLASTWVHSLYEKAS